MQHIRAKLAALAVLAGSLVAQGCTGPSYYQVEFRHSGAMTPKDGAIPLVLSVKEGRGDDRVFSDFDLIGGHVNALRMVAVSGQSLAALEAVISDGLNSAGYSVATGRSMSGRTRSLRLRVLLEDVWAEEMLIPGVDRYEMRMVATISLEALGRKEPVWTTKLEAISGVTVVGPEVGSPVTPQDGFDRTVVRAGELAAAIFASEEFRAALCEAAPGACEEQ